MLAYPGISLQQSGVPEGYQQFVAFVDTLCLLFWFNWKVPHGVSLACLPMGVA